MASNEVPAGMCHTVVRGPRGELLASFLRPQMSPEQTMRFARALRRLRLRGSDKAAERRAKMARDLLERKKALLAAKKRMAALAR